jgi:N-acetylmuramoyl-L-alanine amidase
VDLYRKGSSGREVRDIQGRLSAAGFLQDSSRELSSSHFGEETDRALRAFQQSRGLIADGIVGPDTWRSLVEASRTLGNRFLYLHEPPLRGDDVAELKRRLNALGFYSGKENGIFDQEAALAVEHFQRNSGLSPDGIVGTRTVEALVRLARVTKPTSVAPVRESEKGLPTGGIKGRRVMLDAGHGYPPDPGVIGERGLRESDVAERIVEMSGRLLFKSQAVVLYTRRRSEFLAEEERANRANELDVEAFVSVHLNSSTDPRAGGASCYYFASGNYRSPYGYRLANHIQDELVRTLGVQDCRTHGMAVPLLRETRMPVVIVEPAFVTNPGEEVLLKDKAFLEKVATCIIEGMLKYFAGVKADAEEGS